MENVVSTLSILARYGPFWLFTLSKMKIVHFFYRTFIIYFASTFFLNGKRENFSFLTKSRVKMGRILPKQKQWTIHFSFVVLYMTNYLNINKKLKNVGEIILIFAMDSKLKLAAETFISNSGPKFTCLLLHFCTDFWFLCQTEIVYKKFTPRFVQS